MKRLILVASIIILTLGLTPSVEAFDKNESISGTAKQKLNKIVFREPLKENKKEIKIKAGESITDKLAEVERKRKEANLQTPQLSEPQVLELIQKYFPMTQWQNATNIARCESGLIPNRVGDTSLKFYENGVMYGMSYGVFQIRHLEGRPSPDQLINAEFNVKYAYGMWESQGWIPWSCAKKLNIY